MPDVTRPAQQGKPQLFRWRDAIRSPDGPDDPLDRLLLVELSLWMRSKHAPSADPTIRQMADAVGLHPKNVRERLQRLDGIWFVRARRGKGYEYRPRLPSQGESVPSVSEHRESRHRTPRYGVLTVVGELHRTHGSGVHRTHGYGTTLVRETESASAQGAADSTQGSSAPARADDDRAVQLEHGDGGSRLRLVDLLDGKAREDYLEACPHRREEGTG